MSSYKNVYFVPYESRQKRLKDNTYKKINPDTFSETEISQGEEKMKEKLKNYVETDMIHIPIGTHVRYIVLIDFIPQFRLGGVITKVEDDYVVLSNGRFTWSVQRARPDKDGNKVATRFFKYTKPTKEHPAEP